MHTQAIRLGHAAREVGSDFIRWLCERLLGFPLGSTLLAQHQLERVRPRNNRLVRHDRHGT